MDHRMIRMVAVAVYGVALIVGFVFFDAKVGVAIAVVGAVLLSIAYRAARPAVGEGRQRNRDRQRR